MTSTLLQINTNVRRGRFFLGESSDAIVNIVIYTYEAFRIDKLAPLYKGQFVLGQFDKIQRIELYISSRNIFLTSFGIHSFHFIVKRFNDKVRSLNRWISSNCSEKKSCPKLSNWRQVNINLHIRHIPFKIDSYSNVGIINRQISLKYFEKHFFLLFQPKPRGKDHFFMSCYYSYILHHVIIINKFE